MSLGRLIMFALCLAAATWPAVPAHAQSSPVSDVPCELDAVLDFITVPKRVLALRPDNARTLLAPFAAQLRESGRLEGVVELEHEAADGLVRSVKIIFMQATGEWQLRSLVVMLRPTDRSRVFRDLQRALARRLGKRKWSSPSSRHPEAIGWKLRRRVEVMLQLVSDDELWLVVGEPDGEAD